MPLDRTLLLTNVASRCLRSRSCMQESENEVGDLKIMTSFHQLVVTNVEDISETLPNMR